MGRSHRDRYGDDSAAIVPMPDFAVTSALPSSADPMVAKRSRPCQRKISGGVPRRAAPRVGVAQPYRTTSTGLIARRCSGCTDRTRAAECMAEVCDHVRGLGMERPSPVRYGHVMHKAPGALAARRRRILSHILKASDHRRRRSRPAE